MKSRKWEISDVAILQNPVTILQKQENRPISLMKRAILLFQIIGKFSWCHSCDLPEISPSSGTLTVADIV